MARRWLRAVIAMMVQKMGLSSPRPVAAAQATAEAQVLLQQGIVLYQKGSHAEGEELFKRSLAILEKALGPEHPDAAATLSDLAAVCRDQSRYAEAEPLLKRSLAIREKALG